MIHHPQAKIQEEGNVAQSIHDIYYQGNDGKWSQNTWSSIRKQEKIGSYKDRAKENKRKKSHIDVHHPKTWNLECTCVLRNSDIFIFQLNNYTQRNTEPHPQHVKINGKYTHPFTCVFCSLKYIERRVEVDQMNYHRVTQNRKTFHFVNTILVYLMTQHSIENEIIYLFETLFLHKSWNNTSL